MAALRPRAGRLGVQGALSLPLLVDGGVIGALNAYGRNLNSLDEVSVKAGDAFVRPAAITVATAQAMENSPTRRATHTRSRKRSSPELPVNRWPDDHAAMLLGRLVLRSSVLAGGGSIPSSARNSLSW